MLPVLFLAGTAVMVLAPLLIPIGGAKMAAAVVVARESTRGYRKGEGPLSETYKLRIAPDSDELGCLVSVLANYYADFKSFQGKTVKLTPSERTSLIVHVIAIENHPALRKLREALDKDTASEENQEEILLSVIRLRNTVLPLGDFLVNHDPRRVD